MSLEEELKKLREKKTTYLVNKRKLEENFKEKKISEADFKKERKKLATEWIASKEEYYQKLKGE